MIVSTTRHYTRLAWFCLVLFLTELICPNVALALTSGPSQPEVQSFEPVGTTEMVNLFSGDFTYNIPLFEVPGPEGGYPVNLFYNSVTSMDEEATWTGLGWNINIGALGRMMRGVPDDFSGQEQVSRRLHMRPQHRMSVGTNAYVEVGGVDLGAAFNIRLSQGVVWDSYKGVGFEAGVGVGLESAKINSPYQVGLNLGLNVSTLEGASTNAGFSITRTTSEEVKGKDGNSTKVLTPKGKFNAGLELNGREGVTGLTLGYTQPGNNVFRNATKKKASREGSIKFNSRLSFGEPSYTPSISIPWTGFNLSGSLSLNAGGTLIYGGGGLQGSFSLQSVMGNGAWQSSNAYGYNYLHKISDPFGENFASDINRSGGGVIEYSTRYLTNPGTTYDIYNVMGQGVGGMYRAHHSELGWIYDRSLYSFTAGGTVGVSAGLMANVGADFSLNYSDQFSSHWALDEALRYGQEHPQRRYDVGYEPFYYKVAGDMAADSINAYDYMGGTAPLRLKRNGFNYDQELVDTDNNRLVAFNNNNANNRTGRQPRSMSVQPVRNQDLLGDNGAILLKEFDVQYYEENEVNSYNNRPTKSVDRADNRQNAGFTVLGNNGVRWNYALPVMNTEHREVLFSYGDPSTCTKNVAIETEDGSSKGNKDTKVKHKYAATNDYLDEKDLPAYAHAYMLTSVVGTDYADVDGIAGPSDGDVGYWMKANYIQTAKSYQWRAPFFGANFIEGQDNLKGDNTASFMWGERENYLPASLETKTHIAYFYVSQRDDARGAAHYIQNQNAANQDKYGAHSYKLDRIELYTKKALAANNNNIANTTPLKVVHFAYDYSLCPGVDNNATGGGKLTLKKVWFTYENSSRGALSPYQFEYPTQTVGIHDYNPLKVDRWGALKTGLFTNSDPCALLNEPYVGQGGASAGFYPVDTVKKYNDQFIAAWHLKKITTPSGATIHLELERDDYAYVQDQVATQMMRIDRLESNNQRVYFTLEKPIQQAGNGSDQALLEQYIEDLPQMKNPRYPNSSTLVKQIYLRVKSNLKNQTQPTEEYVPVYAFLARSPNGKEIHFDPSSIVNGQYTKAYVELQQARIKDVTDDPISIFSWMHLRNNLPQQIYEGNLGSLEGNQDFLALAGAMSSIDAIFKGYYKYANEKGFGQSIQAANSFIRLNTPDKIKYGGNIRVKQVTLEDQWDVNQTSTIGVTYDYTTTDEAGKTISSGVVENEPIIGYEACALQYADIFYEYVWNPFVDDFVDNLHLDLMPLNRSYYPGASVGYSQVTVRSIASNIAKQAAEGNTTIIADSDLAEGFSKTGQTVNEFYTCKDFPVHTAMTNIDKQATAPWLSQALNVLQGVGEAVLGTLIKTEFNKYTGTQGYSIELNDMHGKPKKVATYPQNADGSMSTEPLTSIEYVYKTKQAVQTGLRTGIPEERLVLDNIVTVLMDDNPTTGALVGDRLLGVEQESFVDSRQNISRAISGGLTFDVDVVGIFPVPIPLPRASISEYTTRTAVSNKIIKRHGILEKTIAYDGQSRIVTQNLVYHPKTGQPLLTSVDNQLGGKIYNYGVPAYLAHATMGTAADNWGSELKGTLTKTTCSHGYYAFTSTAGQPYQLIPGDEFILTEYLTPTTTQKMRAVYMGELDNGNNSIQPLFDVVDGTLSTISQANVYLKNTRSGNRNLLNATIAQYSAVDTDNLPKTQDGNPLFNRSTATCFAQVVDFEPKIINGQQVVEINPINGPQVPYQTINNVLSASANAYRDHWTMEAQRICAPNAAGTNNPYLLGEKGVWRMESSYAYVDNRKQLEGQYGTVDIKQSGVVDEVPLFNWKHPFYEFCQSKWIRTEDITRYNRDGNPIEARDVIGNYQAEIYGRNDNLVIAKGANTRYYEIGFESFEEPNVAGGLLAVANNGYYSEGNLNFFPRQQNCPRTKTTRQESYRLSYPMKVPNASNISYILVREPYQTATTNDPNRGLSQLKLTLTNEAGEEFLLPINAAQVQPFPLALGIPRLQVPGLGLVLDETTKNDFTVYRIDFSQVDCPPSWNSANWWVGTATLEYEETLLNSADLGSGSSGNCAELVKGYAHTGEYALKLFEANHSNCGPIVFPQRSLHLEPGQDYVISFWMSKYSDQLFTFGEMGFDFNQNAYFSMELGNVVLKPAGPVIEGWQKVEQKFTYSGNPNDKVLRFKITTADAVINPLLIDDVRVFPADGNIQTYVYDPVDYKLRATLDDNNYATFYVYNPEGDLIAVKRETERGIKTIQESRNFIKPTTH